MSFNCEINNLMLNYLSFYRDFNQQLEVCAFFSKEPFQYQKTHALIGNCLSEIQKISSVFNQRISQPHLDAALLASAYTIKKNNGSTTANGKTFAYRPATIEAGGALCQSFQLLSIKLIFFGKIKIDEVVKGLITSELQKFHENWDKFEGGLARDRADAEKLSTNLR